MNRNNKFLLCAASALASAGLASTVRAADETPVLEEPTRPLYRPFTLGLEAGTLGFGGSFSWRFADHWGVRAGVDYMSFSNQGIEVKALHYNADLRLLSEPLTLDIYPWEKSSFHISVGVMFNQNQLTGTADNGYIIVNGQPITIQALGKLDGKVEQQPVNPYLSIGGNFFYFDRAHHWAMGGELGVVYTGDPKASVTSTRSGSVIDQATRIAESQLEDYANKFKWWPVLKLAVTYSF